ncbi:uncharacterized protein LOC114298399 [Camellia sinensis]|uniref:uncharacterized protein LOC114298399 n=1 Tax=Camellia sinensis TaxID=4442 RepID=UPI001036A929|nr:uncharacterized protein LOC114298399 [Camellia sinensis]
MQDYEVSGVDQSDDPLVHFALFSDCDPVTFQDAVKDQKWQKAMDEEIAAIEKNHTWELTDLPKGQKSIRMDVKSAFLHGDLQEQVYVDQPLGYVQQGNVKKILIVCLYVDDIIYTGNNSAMFDDFKQSMMIEFEMFDLGLMHYFLGIEVAQTSAGIFISQKKYVREMLDKFQMANCNSVTTPVEHGFKLIKDHEGRKVDNTLYKQIVGSLMYLTTTRPDIMHAVSLISRYMENPTQLHLLAAKRIFRYLVGTINFGILYRKEGNFGLLGFTDSDYAGDPDDRRSTSGYVFMMGSCVVSWSSKKQQIVTLSITEAEFVAAASCACQAIWLRRLLEELHYHQQGPTPVYCDSSSEIKLSKNPVLHGRSKHIDVRYHFLRDLTKDETIDLIYCRSEDHVADILTKPLKLAIFVKLQRLLGVCSMENTI